MARLRDVPHVLRTVGPVGFALRVWRQGSDDLLMSWAAAVAYSWLFAVFPFFIFLMTLVPYLPPGTKATVGKELHEFIYMFPKEGADALWPQVEGQLLSPPPGSKWLRITGLVVALWAASGGMAMTMTALDRCYELRAGRSYYVQRPFAILLTIVVATLLLLVTVLLPVGGIVKALVIRQNWQGLGEGSPALLAFDIARWVLALLFMISILTVLYHFGPAVKHRFHWLTPGAVFCILVWVGLGIAFKFYVERFVDYNKTYGTVGGAAVMLLFFYIDAAVLLWGAEINSEIDFEVLKVQRGSRNFLPAEAKAEGEFYGPSPATPPAGSAEPPPPVEGEPAAPESR